MQLQHCASGKLLRYRPTDPDAALGLLIYTAWRPSAWGKGAGLPSDRGTIFIEVQVIFDLSQQALINLQVNGFPEARVWSAV